MKINIIGPSCVGKTTVAKIIAKKNKWRHFDLDLEFIDRDYLAQTKIFRFRPKTDYQKRIGEILDSNKDWIIEGVYAVERIFKEADLIIFLNLPLTKALRWQWKRYFTDKNQRSTYGFLNNAELTTEIMVQYLKKGNGNDINDETDNYIHKYDKMLAPYKAKLKVVTTVEDLEKLKKSDFLKNL